MKAIVLVFLMMGTEILAQAADPAQSQPDLAGAKEALSKYPPIKSSGNLLYLDSPEHIGAALNYLDALREQAGVDAAKIKATGLPPNYVDPLIAYEASLGLRSLRARIESELAKAAPKTASALAKSAIYQYTPIGALRSLLNDYEEIAVGGKYYRIKKDTTLSYETLEELIASRALIVGPIIPIFPIALPGCGTNKFTGLCQVYGLYGLCWGLYHQNIFGTLYAGAWTEAFYFSQPNPRYLAYHYASVNGKVSVDYWYQTFCAFYQNTCRASASYNLNFACYRLVFGYRAEHRVRVFQNTMPGWTKGRHYFFLPYIPATAPGTPLSTVL